VAETLTRAVENGGTAVLTGAETTTSASVLTGLGGVGKRPSWPPTTNTPCGTTGR
jgi:hypothetical protein